MSRHKLAASKIVKDTGEVIKRRPVYLPEEITTQDLIGDEWFEAIQSLSKEDILKQFKKLQKKFELRADDNRRLSDKNDHLEDLNAKKTAAIQELQEKLEKCDERNKQLKEDADTHQRDKWILEDKLRVSEGKLLQAVPVVEESDPLRPFSDLLDLSGRKIWTESDHIVARAISRMVIIDSASQIKYSDFTAGIEIESLAEHQINKRHIYPSLKKILRTPVARGGNVQGVKMRSIPPRRDGCPGHVAQLDKVQSEDLDRGCEAVGLEIEDCIKYLRR